MIHYKQLMAIKDVNDLRIYQISFVLLKEIYELAPAIDRCDRDMSRSLKKTAAQIAPQIAEGYGKKSSAKEFKRFLVMAMGSSDEMVTHLKQIGMVCSAVNSMQVIKLIEDYRSLARQIHSLVK